MTIDVPCGHCVNWECQLMQVVLYTTTTTTVLRPFVRDYPGEPVPDHHPTFISFFHLPRSIASSLLQVVLYNGRKLVVVLVVVSRYAWVSQYTSVYFFYLFHKRTFEDTCHREDVLPLSQSMQSRAMPCIQKYSMSWIIVKNYHRQLTQ